MSSSAGITLLGALFLLFLLFHALRILKPEWNLRRGSCLFSLITCLCAGALLFSFWGKAPADVPAPVSTAARIAMIGGTDERPEIVTLNARDGSKAWTYSYFHANMLTQINKGNKGAPYDLYLTMTTDETAVYTVWSTGKDALFTFIALNKQNGRVLWSISHQSNSEEPNCDTPFTGRNLVVSGRTVYVLMMCGKYMNADHTTMKPIGIIYALQAQNGTVLWRKTLAPLFLSGINASLAATANVLFVGSDDTTYALRTSDGRNVWTLSSGGEPLIGGDMVYILGQQASYPGGEAHQASSFRMQDGAACYGPMHSIAPFPEVTSCMPLSQSSQGTIYEQRYPGPEVTSLAFSGSTLYLTQRAATSPYMRTLYAISEPEGKVRWKHLLPEATQGPAGTYVVVQGNGVYVADEATLYALQENNGKQIWQRTINPLSEIDAMSSVDGILFIRQHLAQLRMLDLCIVNCEPSSGVFEINSMDGSIYWRKSL